MLDMHWISLVIYLFTAAAFGFFVGVAFMVALKIYLLP